MEVILLTELPKKGGVGTLVKVAPGFARNYLLPNKLALLASKKNKQELQHQMRLAEHHKSRARAEALAYADKVSAMTLTFARKVGEQGKLFGSVTSLDVYKALQEAGVKVEKHDVDLKQTIHQLGPDTADVRLGDDVRAKVNIMVVVES